MYLAEAEARIEIAPTRRSPRRWRSDRWQHFPHSSSPPWRGLLRIARQWGAMDFAQLNGADPHQRPALASAEI